MFHNRGNDGRLEYLSNNCEMVDGCYITDLLKIEGLGTNAKDVIKNTDKRTIENSLRILKKEYITLGKPRIIIFGNHAEKIIKNNLDILKKIEFDCLLEYQKIIHYSFRNSKHLKVENESMNCREKYCEYVKRELGI